jgi:bacteriophage HK97-gp10 putative tail-component
VAVTHKLNQREIEKILTSPTGPVAKALLVRGYRVQAQARKNLGGGTSGPKRIDTGHLRASISVQLHKKSTRTLFVRVGTNLRYATWVHDGTGLYGPLHRVIRPKTKRYLRFKPHGSNKYVYAKFVKGMRPNPFLANAIFAARIGPQAA